MKPNGRLVRAMLISLRHVMIPAYFGADSEVPYTPTR